jgi:membrane protease YdiL (CAAX protease family)
MVLERLSPRDQTLEETAFSTTAILILFVVAYIPLLIYMGYSYSLHIVSTMAFSIIGVAVIFIMFRKDNVAGKRTQLVLGSMVLIVTIEEILLNSPYAVYGLTLAIAGFVLVPVIGLKLGENDWMRTALDAVALIFATRVVLSPFPVGYFKTSVFLPLIYTLILASIVVYLTLRNIPSEMIRLKLGNVNIVKQARAGLIVGGLIGGIEYLILRPQAVLETSGFMRAFFYTLTVMAVMVGIAEEVLFRGLLQTSLEKEIPGWQAIGVSAILFGLMHVGWMNPLEVLLAYGAGVVFGYLAIHMESLIAPVVAHGFGNLMLYMIPVILRSLQ